MKADIRIASNNGPAGKFGTLENMYRVNAEKVHSYNHSDQMPYDSLSSQHGKVFLRDSRDEQYTSWLAGADFIELVPRLEEILDKSYAGIQVPVDGKESPVNWKSPLTAYDTIFLCNLNNAGRNLSKYADAVQKLRDYARSEEGQEQIIKLLKEGNAPPELEAIAVGLLPKDNLMAVYPGEHGYILRKSNRFYEQLKAEAGRLGMSIDEYTTLKEELVLAEEITHGFHGLPNANIFNRIKAELKAKEFVLGLYLKKGGRKNRIQAALMKDDIADIGRYWNSYMGIHEAAAKVGISDAELDSMIEMYAAESEEGGEAAVAYALSKAKSEVAAKQKDKAKESKAAESKEDTDSDSENAEESSEEASD